jgi:hypothetical protein
MALEYWPASHSVQLPDAAADHVPAGQMLQSAADSNE